MSKPLHDWVCDSCGRKVYGRRDPPKRCHGMPMRPMGSPWKDVVDKFYCAFESRPPGSLTALPDDYWICPKVLERLQKVVDATPGMLWRASVKAKKGIMDSPTYHGLTKKVPVH